MHINSLSRYFIIALVTLILGTIIYRFSEIISYVIIAWVISLMGSPMMGFFKKIRIGKFGLPNSVAAGLTLGSFLLLIISILALFIPVFFTQAMNLSEVDYKSIAVALDEPFQNILQWLKSHGIPVELINLEELVSSLTKGWFEPTLITEILSTFFSTASSFVVAIASILFIAFFFIQEQVMFLRFILTFIPDNYVEQTQNAIKESIRLLSRYFNGLLIQMLLITIYMMIMLTLFGIKNALIIAFFAALMNLIPYLGPIFGAAFAALITLSSNLDLSFYTEVWPQLVTVVLIFVSMQMLDNYIFQPFIFSKSVLAHPLEIFVIILIGANLAGITGMVLAIPIYTIFRSFAKIFFEKFKIVQLMTKNMNESGF
jgi:predicted PurR-regulated permease PerM